MRTLKLKRDLTVSMSILCSWACTPSAAPERELDDGPFAPDAASGGDARVDDDAARPANDAGVDAATLGDAGEIALPDKPQKLSETGLYRDVASEELAEGVLPYTPRYALWSDGAEKRRWLLLPEGAQIDTSNMDFWTFPVGTRLWKEFTKDGVRVETRLLLKVAEGTRGWYMMAFGWNAQQTEALALPEGQRDALGTGHDIPEQAACRDCHANVPDIALGVSAMQLSYEGAGTSLASLAEAGHLSVPPVEASLNPPGDTKTAQALGYLHANCGTCHNPQSAVFERNELDLSLSVGALSGVEQTAAYLTTVGQSVSEITGDALIRVVPGDPLKSALIERMGRRGVDDAMPPLGTAEVDAQGMALVSAWITALGDAPTPP